MALTPEEQAELDSLLGSVEEDKRQIDSLNKVIEQEQAAKEPPTGFGDIGTAILPATSLATDLPEQKAEIEATAGVPIPTGGGDILPVIGDVGSLFTRGLAAFRDLITGEDKETALKTLQDPDAGILKGTREESRAFYDDLIAKTDDTATKAALQGVKFLAEASLGVIEDPSTLLTGATKLLGKSAKALSGVEKGLKTATELPAKATAGLSGQLTGVSGEALQEAGLGVGKKAGALKAASQEAGTAFNIGEDLVQKLNKFDELIPEATKINQTLFEMGRIETKGIVDALENSKIANAATPAAKNANKVIDETVKNIQSLKPDLSAKNFRDLRIQFDEGIEFGKPGFDTVEKAFFNARRSMAQDLIKSARKSGKPEFVQVMKDFAKKLETRDKLIKLLGRNQTTQATRAETFVNNLFGKGKTAKQNIVKRFDEVFGEDFFKQIKTAKLSGELGPKGVPELLPKSGGSRQIAAAVTGAAAFSPVKMALLPAVVALSSPKVSTKIIGLFDLIGEGSFRLSKGLAKLSIKDETIAAEAFNSIIKALPTEDTNKISDLMGKREAAKNDKTKSNIDKRISLILERGN